MEMLELNFEFFDKCTSLSDAARKIFGRDNYRDCEKIKQLTSKYCFDWKIWGERRKKKTEVVHCLNCGEEIEVPIGWKNRNKFCSQSCAAIYNNHKRTNANGWHKMAKHTNCIYCGKDLYDKPYGVKYCSNECQNKHAQEEYIKRWKNGEETGLSGKYGISKRIRNYLFEKYNNKCQICGWNKENPITNKVPLQIHHIDGDCTNNKEENLQLLCPNCHSLTETFGNLNENSKRVYRKQKGNVISGR